MIKKSIIGLFAIIGLFILPGCDVSQYSVGSIDLNNWQETIKKYLSGSRETLSEAGGLKKTIEERNVVYDTAENIPATAQIAKSVDDLIRPILGGLFGGVKLTLGGESQATPFIMQYVTEGKISQDDGDLLNRALLDAGSLPKEGSPPNYQEDKGTFEVSVYHDFGGHTYILVVLMDLKEQVIWVKVY